ncbi:MAG: alpha-1,2-fucosyltransferase [Candidatus Magasanikbacteria bacterium CG_4_10_14_0_8_um_filter_32_14]|uniref:Alpha-1,2-fucosyltransferase n=1 Tax=Candidatus Magasanikbacteria bacterium CG_4_10_14_0_8_um_filter_32_14 TaxID=1974640 RepID=A0A2M7RAS4_9BACT|nr:MAG: alpha-1,2-fucosyltransferase [Candidatus Magasanikbacteria bacterium CG_4_10_14_0_8_um_filter_32_14]
MIFDKLSGGLGNQMFQYAAGYSLSLNNRIPLNLDLSSFEHKKTGITHRYFLLNKFNIDRNILINHMEKISGYRKFLSKFITKFFGENFYYNITFLSSKYLDGYFQSEKYFKNIEDILRKEFTLKNEMSVVARQVESKISNSINSVSLHIRRGDYVLDNKTNSYHGICDLDYYKKAVEYFKNKLGELNIFVFSDDIAWVKENLRLENLYFVSSPDIKDYEELILMSRCKHNIIANSSFSWWGAWLNANKNKTVITPKKWFQKYNINQKHIVPKSWIRL